MQSNKETVYATKRIKVSKLGRFTQDDGTHWYVFNGYSIGPFEYEEELEAYIKKYYEEKE